MFDKCFFTVATGAKYLNFSFVLARSYGLHNDKAIPFFIISNADFHLPSDLKWVQKKIISKELMGSGLEYRFHFNEIVPAENSFFIDADSIVYGNLVHLFDIPNKSIRVIGLKETMGNWAHLQLPATLQDFDVNYIIRYCGAFYYIVKGNLAREICTRAYQLAISGYVFQQHTQSINDEPVFSISMSKAGVEPYPDDGNIWADTVQLKSHKDLNTLYSTTIFNNSKKCKYKYWLPEGDYHPLIVHFGGGIYNKNPWLFDALRLRLHVKYGLPKSVSNFIINQLVKPGYFLAKTVRNNVK